METCSLLSLKIIISHLDTYDLLFGMKMINRRFHNLLENKLFTSPPKGAFIGYTPETYFYGLFPKIDRLDIKCLEEVKIYNYLKHHSLTYENLFFKRALEPDKWKSLSITNQLINQISQVMGHKILHKYENICQNMPYRLPYTKVNVYGRNDYHFNLLFEFYFKGSPGYRFGLILNEYRFSERDNKFYFGLPKELKHLKKYIYKFFNINVSNSSYLSYK